MSVDPNELLSLPAVEQLRLVELLWDNLGKSTDPIPLPDWVEVEALRRRDEMIVNPELGSNHDAVWSKINRRNG
jgi:putative addiction module component (TIGR02574 family)